MKILFALSLILFAVSILLYIFTGFGLFYLVVASVLGVLMIYANTRLLFSTISVAAWRVYKFSSFPYLGIIFLVMFLDTLLL